MILSAEGTPTCLINADDGQNIQGKGKGRPRTGHEGPEREKRYSSTLSITSALDRVGGQRHAPAALPPRKIR